MLLLILNAGGCSTSASKPTSRADLFAGTPPERRAVMAKVRSAGTGLEQKMAAIVADLALSEAETCVTDLPGKPDFVWRSAKVVLFVHSCFWHGCPQHHRAVKTRQEYWIPKIDRNRQRDREVAKTLRAAGWKVVVVWEHELKRDELPKTIRRLRRNLRLLRQADRATPLDAGLNRTEQS